MKTRHDELVERVRAYHAKHPEVWELFVKYSFELIERGFQHHSVSAVFDRIRWEGGVGADGQSEFKIANDYKPFYARAFMRKYPQTDGFYRLRPQNTKNKPARGRETQPRELQYVSLASESCA